MQIMLLQNTVIMPDFDTQPRRAGFRSRLYRLKLGTQCHSTRVHEYQKITPVFTGRVSHQCITGVNTGRVHGVQERHPCLPAVLAREHG